MNRALRRKLARAATCCLCFEPMTQHDRAVYRTPDIEPGTEKLGAAHPLCIAKEAQQRATRAENKVAAMQQAATTVQTHIQAAQRAQELGIWLPGCG